MYTQFNYPQRKDFYSGDDFIRTEHWSTSSDNGDFFYHYYLLINHERGQRCGDPVKHRYAHDGKIIFAGLNTLYIYIIYTLYIYI